MKLTTLNSWLALCQRLGATGNCAKEGRALLARYSEPHRAYHNIDHLEFCFEHLTHAAAEQPDIIALALWFHDAIYDPRATDNEQQSATLARGFCQGAQLAGAVGERIAELILFTKTHQPGLDRDAQLLVDIDLGILGQNPERFDQYENAIREEYAWIPECAFIAGRSDIIKQFLSRPTIYSTPPFQALYEQPARKNLLRALSQLQAHEI